MPRGCSLPPTRGPSARWLRSSPPPVAHASRDALRAVRRARGPRHGRVVSSSSRISLRSSLPAATSPRSARASQKCASAVAAEVASCARSEARFFQIFSDYPTTNVVGPTSPKRTHLCKTGSVSWYSPARAPITYYTIDLESSAVYLLSSVF